MNRRQFIKNAVIGVGALTLPITKAEPISGRATTLRYGYIPRPRDFMYGHTWDTFEYHKLMNRRAISLTTITAKTPGSLSSH